jgi:hypothetical protein
MTAKDCVPSVGIDKPYDRYPGELKLVLSSMATDDAARQDRGRRADDTSYDRLPLCEVAGGAASAQLETRALASNKARV